MSKAAVQNKEAQTAETKANVKAPEKAPEKAKDPETGYDVTKLAPNDKLSKLRQEQAAKRAELKKLNEQEKSLKEEAEKNMPPEERAVKLIKRYSWRIEKLINNGDYEGVETQAKGILEELQTLKKAKASKSAK